MVSYSLPSVLSRTHSPDVNISDARLVFNIFKEISF